MQLKLLLVVTHNGKKMDDQVLSTVTAVKQMVDHFDVIIFGHQLDKILNQVRSIPDANTVFVIDDPKLKNFLAEPVTDVLLEMVKSYDRIVFSSNTSTKNLMPRLAAKCDISPISDVCAIDKKGVFKRPIYAGNIIESVSSQQKKLLLSIRAASFNKSSLLDKPVAKIKKCSVQIKPYKTKYIKSKITKMTRPDLSAAKIVVSGGRGLGSEKSFDLVYELADCLNAAVGASRAAVDAGFVSNDFQVGQTGKIIAPEVYIAIGISGAIQHLAGMKDSQVIIAINQDEDAPIFKSSDYGLVADLFDVLPKITKHLATKK
ncbi:MAG: FAD-binding protein [Pseudomonadota bacterium]|nr:FAD-binding protein [Pseudomonadota bacterium]